MPIYVPPHFSESRPEVLDAFVRKYPLASVITHTGDEMFASHIPLTLDVLADGSRRLQGHFARGNPQWRTAQDGGRALAIFHGPQAYVTPSWYPSKRINGRVVPTWLYVVVHVEGRIAIVDDRDYLERHLRALTHDHEHARARPWGLDDAPPEYLDATMKRIVPFEITATRMSGKWKLDQNQPAHNRDGVAEGLLEAEQQVLSALVRKDRVV
ncbi:MAG TPA: FMN-binding negative transcriptional regulator [Vicinamibacterales bacterium]|nr:FMN-binding negative transcriptional regulator [Vicinamibacterales bacterium]